MFDIVNLFISSKRLKGLILNSSINYKRVFESMSHVCDEKLWDRILSFNFSIFLNRVKRNLEDNLEIFLYLKFGFYSFVLSNLSSYSVFSHFCFCKRTCDQKKSNECYCQFCSWIYLQIFDNHNTFQGIIVDNEILLVNLIISSKRLHFFLLTFAKIMHFL